jgi:hypothetical protein
MQLLTEQLKVGTSFAVRDGLAMVYLQRTHGDFVYMNDPAGARRAIATAPIPSPQKLRHAPAGARKYS